MPSLRNLSIPDLVADSSLVRGLIDEGETLFVERKESNPADGLGPTVASFANMLGGWLLLGVDDDGEVVGYEPPGTADLQDYVRDLLRTRVDPLPPFAALTVPVGELKVGVVRVAESSDTPHVTSDGVIYVRNPGGKQRVNDHRDILEMARRGEQARQRAAQRQYGLALIETAMMTPELISGERSGDEAILERPLLEWIVRATPYTVTGAFADRALSAAAAEFAEQQVVAMAEGVPGPFQQDVTVDARARGLHCVGGQRVPTPMRLEMAIDAGGVIAVRRAWRRTDDYTLVLRFMPDDWLVGPIRSIADTLGALDGYGRVAIGLEIRGALDLMVERSPGYVGLLGSESLTPDERLFIGGDLAVPASDQDVRELAERWAREIARAAGLPMWEPGYIAQPATADEADEPS